jgi:hypothetical protein
MSPHSASKPQYTTGSGRTNNNDARDGLRPRGNYNNTDSNECQATLASQYDLDRDAIQNPAEELPSSNVLLATRTRTPRNNNCTIDALDRLLPAQIRNESDEPKKKLSKRRTRPCREAEYTWPSSPDLENVQCSDAQGIDLNTPPSRTRANAPTTSNANDSHRRMYARDKSSTGGAEHQRDMVSGTNLGRSIDSPSNIETANARSKHQPRFSESEDRQQTRINDLPNTTYQKASENLHKATIPALDDEELSQDEEDGGVNLGTPSATLSEDTAVLACSHHAADAELPLPKDAEMTLTDLVRDFCPAASEKVLEDFRELEVRFHSNPEFLADLGKMIQDLNMKYILHNYIDARRQRVLVNLIELEDIINDSYMSRYNVPQDSVAFKMIGSTYKKFSLALETRFRRLYEQIEMTLFKIPAFLARSDRANSSAIHHLKASLFVTMSDMWSTYVQDLDRIHTDYSRTWNNPRETVARYIRSEIHVFDQSIRYQPQWEPYSGHSESDPPLPTMPHIPPIPKPTSKQLRILRKSKMNFDG